MKALILTSNNLRHRYFSLAVTKYFDAPTALVEEKRAYYSKQRTQSALVRDHFDRIAGAEMRWFPEASDRKYPFIQKVSDINSIDLVAWACKQGFDVICLFGTSILGSKWLEAFPDKIVNLHLGLSPFYRGSATLFWPFVNRELEYLGTTIHLATARVDAGEILARIDPDLRPRENYYDITTRLIRDSIDEFPNVVAAYLQDQVKPFCQENVLGKLYRKADFAESALKEALDYVAGGLSEYDLNQIKVRRECRYSR